MATSECNPYCPVPNLREDMSEIKDSMQAMHEKQDKLIELNVYMKTLREEVKELKDDNKKEKSNIFSRISTLEQNTVSKKDLGLALAALGVILTVVNIIITVLLKVMKVT